MRKSVIYKALIKAVSMVVVCLFTFETVCLDMAMGHSYAPVINRPASSEQLSVPSFMDDILSPASRDKNQIRMAFRAILEALDYEWESEIDLRALIRKANEEEMLKSSHFKGLQFFSYEAGSNEIVARFNDKSSGLPRTYNITVPMRLNQIDDIKIYLGSFHSEEIETDPNSKKPQITTHKSSNIPFYATEAGWTLLINALDNYIESRKTKVIDWRGDLLEYFKIEANYPTPKMILDELKAVLTRTGGQTEETIARDVRFVYIVNHYLMSSSHIEIRSYADLARLVALYENPFCETPDSTFKILDLGSGLRDPENPRQYPVSLKGIAEQAALRRNIDPDRVRIVGSDYELGVVTDNQTLGNYVMFLDVSETHHNRRWPGLPMRRMEDSVNDVDMVTMCNPDWFHLDAEMDRTDFLESAFGVLKEGGEVQLVLNVNYYNPELLRDFISSSSEIEGWFKSAGFTGFHVVDRIDSLGAVYFTAKKPGDNQIAVLRTDGETIPKAEKITLSTSEAQGILDVFFKALEETGDFNIALYDVMESLFSKGYDHLVVSRAWKMLRKVYPHGKVPSDRERSCEQIGEALQKHLNKEKVFQSIFMLTTKEKPVTVSVIAAGTNLDENTVREIVNGLRKSERVTIKEGTIILTDDNITASLIQRVYEVYQYEEASYGYEELLEKVRTELSKGVIRGRGDYNHVLNAREFYLEATQDPGYVVAEGYKTYFGRDEAGLSWTTRWALQGKKYNDPGEELNILFLGASTGQQAYDAASMIIENIERGRRNKDLSEVTFKGRVNIVCTDIVPTLVDHGLKGYYDTSDVNGKRESLERNFPEDVSLRTRFIRTDHVKNDRIKLISPRTFADKWNIHFSWQVLDVLDEAAVEELAGRMRFDAIIGSNVHYKPAGNKGETAVRKATELFFKHANSLLREDGIFHYAYARQEYFQTGSYVETPKEYALIRHAYQIVDKENLEAYEKLPEKVLADCSYDDAVESYAIAKWFKGEYDRANDKEKVIETFLDNAIVPKERAFARPLFKGYSLALMHLFLDKELRDEQIIEDVFKYFQNTRGWGYFLLITALTDSAGALTEENLSKFIEDIRSGLSRYPPTDHDVSQLVFEAGLASREIIKTHPGSSVKKIVDLLSLHKYLLKEYLIRRLHPGGEGDMIDEKYDAFVTNVLYEFLFRQEDFDKCRIMSEVIAELKATGYLRGISKKYLETNKETEFNVWHNIRKDQKQNLSEEVIRRINSIQSILLRLKKKTRKDFILQSLINHKTGYIVYHLIDHISDDRDDNNMRQAVLARFRGAFDELKKLKQKVAVYEEEGFHSRFFGKEMQTIDVQRDLDALIIEISRLKEVVLKEKNWSENGPGQTVPVPELSTGVSPDEYKIVEEHDEIYPYLEKLRAENPDKKITVINFDTHHDRFESSQERNAGNWVVYAERYRLLDRYIHIKPPWQYQRIDDHEAYLERDGFSSSETNNFEGFELPEDLEFSEDELVVVTIDMDFFSLFEESIYDYDMMESQYLTYRPSRKEVDYAVNRLKDIIKSINPAGPVIISRSPRHSHPACLEYCLEALTKAFSAGPGDLPEKRSLDGNISTRLYSFPGMFFGPAFYSAAAVFIWISLLKPIGILSFNLVGAAWAGMRIITYFADDLKHREHMNKRWNFLLLAGISLCAIEIIAANLGLITDTILKHTTQVYHGLRLLVGIIMLADLWQIVVDIQTEHEPTENLTHLLSYLIPPRLFVNKALKIKEKYYELVNEINEELEKGASSGKKGRHLYEALEKHRNELSDQLADVHLLSNFIIRMRSGYIDISPHEMYDYILPVPILKDRIKKASRLLLKFQKYKKTYQQKPELSNRKVPDRIYDIWDKLYKEKTKLTIKIVRNGGFAAKADKWGDNDGQKLYISEKLLELSDDEIAFVLAHEAAHLLELDWPKPGFLTGLFFHDREKELKAHEEGFTIAVMAGFDPRAALKIVDRSLKWDTKRQKFIGWLKDLAGIEPSYERVKFLYEKMLMDEGSVSETDDLRPPTPMGFRFDFPVSIFNGRQIDSADKAELLSRLQRAKLHWARPAVAQKETEARMEYFISHVERILGFLRKHRPQYEIINISLFGSYLWAEDPGDIDFDVIVKGNAYEMILVEKDEEKEELFPVSDPLPKPVPKIEITVIGEDNLVQGARYERPLPFDIYHADRVIETTRADFNTRNVVLYGEDFDSLAKHSLHNSVANTYTLLENAYARITRSYPPSPRTETDQKRYGTVVSRLLKAGIYLNHVLPEDLKMNLVDGEVLLAELKKSESVSALQVHKAVTFYGKIWKAYEAALLEIALRYRAQRVPRLQGLELDRFLIKGLEADLERSRQRLAEMTKATNSAVKGYELFHQELLRERIALFQSRGQESEKGSAPNAAQPDIEAALKSLYSEIKHSGHATSLFLLMRLIKRSEECIEKGITPSSILAEGKVLNVGLETDDSEKVIPQNLVNILSKAGIDIIGLDPNIETGGLYKKGIVQNMPFGDKEFDTVISSGLFDPDYVGVLAVDNGLSANIDGYIEWFYEVSAKEINRILKDGGICLINSNKNSDILTEAFARNGFEYVNIDSSGGRLFIKKRDVERKNEDAKSGDTIPDSGREEGEKSIVSPELLYLDRAVKSGQIVLQTTLYKDDRELSLRELQEKTAREIERQSGLEQKEKEEAFEEAKSFFRNYADDFETIWKTSHMELLKGEFLEETRTEVLKWADSHFEPLYLHMKALDGHENVFSQREWDAFICTLIRSYQWAIEIEELYNQGEEGQKHVIVEKSEVEEGEEWQKDQDSNLLGDLMSKVAGNVFAPVFLISSKVFSGMSYMRHHRVRSFLIEMLSTSTAREYPLVRSVVLSTLVGSFYDNDLLPMIEEELARKDTKLRKDIMEDLVSYVDQSEVRSFLLKKAAENIASVGRALNYLIYQASLDKIPPQVKQGIRFFANDDDPKNVSTLGVYLADHKRFQKTMKHLADYLDYRENGGELFEYRSDQFTLRVPHSAVEAKVFKRDHRSYPSPSPWDGKHFVLVDNKTGDVIAGYQLSLCSFPPDSEKMPYYATRFIFSKDLQKEEAIDAYFTMFEGTLKAMDTGLLEKGPIRIERTSNAFSGIFGLNGKKEMGYVPLTLAQHYTLLEHARNVLDWPVKIIRHGEEKWSDPAIGNIPHAPGHVATFFELLYGLTGKEGFERGTEHTIEELCEAAPYFRGSPLKSDTKSRASSDLGMLARARIIKKTGKGKQARYVSLLTDKQLIEKIHERLSDLPAHARFNEVKIIIDESIYEKLNEIKDYFMVYKIVSAMSVTIDMLMEEYEQTRTFDREATSKAVELIWSFKNLEVKRIIAETPEIDYVSYDRQAGIVASCWARDHQYSVLNWEIADVLEDIKGNCSVVHIDNEESGHHDLYYGFYMDEHWLADINIARDRNHIGYYLNPGTVILPAHKKLNFKTYFDITAHISSSNLDIDFENKILRLPSSHYVDDTWASPLGFSWGSRETNSYFDLLRILMDEYDPKNDEFGDTVIIDLDADVFLDLDGKNESVGREAVDHKKVEELSFLIKEFISFLESKGKRVIFSITPSLYFIGKCASMTPIAPEERKTIMQQIVERVSEIVLGSTEKEKSSDDNKFKIGQTNSNETIQKMSELTGVPIEEIEREGRDKSTAGAPDTAEGKNKERIQWVTPLWDLEQIKARYLKSTPARTDPDFWRLLFSIRNLSSEDVDALIEWARGIDEQEVAAFKEQYPNGLFHHDEYGNLHFMETSGRGGWRHENLFSTSVWEQKNLALYHSSYNPVLELRDRIPEREADDSWKLLEPEVIKIAERLNLKGHGALNFSADTRTQAAFPHSFQLQHEWNLLNIIFKGGISGGSVGTFKATGRNWYYYTNLYGPYYVILADKHYTIPFNPPKPEDLLIYLVPDKNAVAFLHNGIREGEKLGFISPEDAEVARSKIMTYQEFVDAAGVIPQIMDGTLLPPVAVEQAKSKPSFPGAAEEGEVQTQGHFDVDRAKDEKNTDGGKSSDDGTRESGNQRPMSLDNAAKILRPRKQRLTDYELAYSVDAARKILTLPVERIVIVGNSLFYLPLLLALCGKEVVFIDQEASVGSAVNMIMVRAASISRDIGWELKIKGIMTEIGILDLEAEGLETGAYDLITFLDLIGGRPEGTPKIWLEKAKKLLKPEAYLLIDETPNLRGSLIESLPRVFPQHEQVAGMGLIKGSSNYNNTAVNRMYRVREEETPDPSTPVARSGQDGSTRDVRSQQGAAGRKTSVQEPLVDASYKSGDTIPDPRPDAGAADVPSVDHLLEKNRQAMQSHSRIKVLIPAIGKEIYVYKNVFNPLLTNVSPLLGRYLDVRPKDTILDVGGGTGFQAIVALEHGASNALVLDIAPESVLNVQANAELLDLGNRLQARQSDVFSALSEDEKFSLITFNPPLLFGDPSNPLERAVYDKNFEVITKFMKGVSKHLTPDGRVRMIYSSKHIELLIRLAQENNLNLEWVAQRTYHGETYFDVELTTIKTAVITAKSDRRHVQNTESEYKFVTTGPFKLSVFDKEDLKTLIQEAVSINRKTGIILEGINQDILTDAKTGKLADDKVYQAFDREGKIIGYLMAANWPGNRNAGLYVCVVKKDSEPEVVGSAILDRAIEDLRLAGVVTISIAVDWASKRNLAMWDKIIRQDKYPTADLHFDTDERILNFTNWQDFINFTESGQLSEEEMATGSIFIDLVINTDPSTPVARSGQDGSTRDVRSQQGAAGRKTSVQEPLVDASYKSGDTIPDPRPDAGAADGDEKGAVPVSTVKNGAIPQGDALQAEPDDASDRVPQNRMTPINPNSPERININDGSVSSCRTAKSSRRSRKFSGYIRNIDLLNVYVAASFITLPLIAIVVPFIMAVSVERFSSAEVVTAAFLVPLVTGVIITIFNMFEKFSYIFVKRFVSKELLVKFGLISKGYSELTPIQRAELTREELIRESSKRGDQLLIKALSDENLYGFEEFEKWIDVWALGKDAANRTIFITKELTLIPFILRYIIIRRALGLLYNTEAYNPQSEKGWCSFITKELTRRLHYYPGFAPYVIARPFLKNTLFVLISKMIAAVTEPTNSRSSDAPQAEPDDASDGVPPERMAPINPNSPERININDGAVERIAKQIDDAAGTTNKPITVGIDGDKHVFKSTYTKALFRALRMRSLPVKLIDTDDYYEEGWYMDGELVKEERWDWRRMAGDIRLARESGEFDVILVEGYELYNIVSASDMVPREFNIKIRLEADEATRQWVFQSYDGLDPEKAVKATEEWVQSYPEELRIDHDFIVNTSIDFWKTAEPTVVELFVEQFGSDPREAIFSLLPDGGALKKTGALPEDKVFRDGQLDKLELNVKDVVEYLPLRPLISECDLVPPTSEAKKKLDDLFNVERQYAPNGKYIALFAERQIFAIGRFDAEKLTCDLITITGEDMSPGGPVDYWVKRRAEMIRINPIHGTRDMVGADVRVKYDRLAGVDVMLRKEGDDDIPQMGKKAKVGHTVAADRKEKNLPPQADIEAGENKAEKTSEAFSEIRSSAEETGLAIPTNIHNGRYTLLVDYSLYKNDKEMEADKWGYDIGGRHVGFGDRFNLEIADTSNIDNLLAHVRAIKEDEIKRGIEDPEKAFERIIVKVPCEFSDEALERLKAEAPGIRILRIDTTELGLVGSDEERRDLRFDLYAMMLSARRITADDVTEENAVYRSLSFFLNTHYGDGEEDIAEKLIKYLVNGDLGKVILYNLSFRPAGRWDNPEYHTIARVLISA